VLSADARFESTDGLWRLSASTNEQSDDPAFVVAVSPVRQGTALRLRPWQNAALRAWQAAGRRGIVTAVTGAGKTWVGVGAIAEYLNATTARVAVLVPTIELQAQWVRTLRGVFTVPVGAVGDGFLDLFSDSVILVYVARSAADTLSRTVRQNARRYAILLVADECHRYGSGTYAGALDAPFSATLGLSATPERDGDDGMANYVLPRLGDVVYESDHVSDVVCEARVFRSARRIRLLTLEVPLDRHDVHGDGRAGMERAVRKSLLVPSSTQHVNGGLVCTERFETTTCGPAQRTRCSQRFARSSSRSLMTFPVW
jgi:hypothetical protein